MEIQSLKQAIRTRFSPLMSSEEARASFELETLLQDAKSVDLLGYSLSSLLKNYRKPIAEASIKGTRIRILLVDVTRETGNVMRNHANKPHMVEREGKAGLEFAQDIERNIKSDPDAKGSVNIRLTSWIPSCNMIVVNGQQTDGVAKIGIHPPSYRQPAQGRRYLVLHRPEHMQDFDYFAEQFNALWREDGEPLPK
jgi:hypothetical protein